MRDYTINNYCDFLWINDLLELKKNSKYGFTFETWKNGKATRIYVCNVIIFGTIVEIKQVGCKGYLYHVDDGTGVIACKHNEQQFEEIISEIESEQCDMLNRTLQSDRARMYDTTADDSIFNDKSIQMEELDVNERSTLMGLQSIWENIYESFNSVTEQYIIGDAVVIEGKVYSYFNRNQIYINSIRKMDMAEEIAKVGIKLEEKFDKMRKNASVDSQFNRERLSGLMTFDNIQHLNPKFPNPRSIKTPEMKNIEEETKILTPNLESAITFDTFPTEFTQMTSAMPMAVITKAAVDEAEEHYLCFLWKVGAAQHFLLQE